MLWAVHPGEGGGYSLTVAMRVCATQQGYVFGTWSWAGYNIQAVS